MSMDELVTLQESGGAPTKKGKRWLVTVARPGTGSTGTYPEDVLRETGPLAIPAGTKAFFKHARPEDRDVRDMVGKYEDGAFWNEEAGELQAYLTPYPRYADVLEQAGSDIEASIRVKARKDARGVVTEMIYDRANTVDLVAFGGLEGSRLQFQVESLFASVSADDENGKKEENMEITKEMWDVHTSNLATLGAKFDAFVAESRTELQASVDAAALEDAVASRVEEALASYNENVEAIDKADIFAVMKESLKASARKGEDITQSLADAVSFCTEARKELVEAQGNPAKGARGNVVVASESVNDNADIRPTLWSKR